MVVPEVVPDVVPVVLPLVVPEVVPVVVLPLVDPDVLPIEPEVEPEPEVLSEVDPAFSEAEQAENKVSDEQSSAPVSKESKLRFIWGMEMWKGRKQPELQVIRAFALGFTRNCFE